MRIILDVWEARFRAFNTFARTPSRYGGFEYCFQSHMTAEEVVKDTVWYRAARADPKTHLPRFYDWLATPRIRGAVERMTPDRRRVFELRGAAFLEALEAAENLHLKWNARTWTRPRFLFGVLCLEERRQMFATKLLEHLGYGGRLDAALGGRDRAQPGDEVDKELLVRLEASHVDGSLAKVRTYTCMHMPIHVAHTSDRRCLQVVAAWQGARRGSCDRRAALARDGWAARGSRCRRVAA